LLASDSSEAAIAADAAAAEDGPPESGADVRPASERPLVDAAAALADDIMGQAIEGEDGSMTWIAPAYLRTGERTDRGVSYYLHGGASGIALFLAAAARVTGNDDYRAAASAACAPIVTVLDSGSADKLLEYEGIGACNGLGGIVYAMTWIGRLLDDSSFTDTAARVAEFITEERIGSDTLFDVEGGAAGAILGLLALHRATAEGWTLDRAAACGRHLVDSARTGDSGGAAWPGPEGLMLAGFAHGAAGIAHALAHLYRETGELPLLDAVGKAYQYERGVFSPEARNWPLLQIQGASGELERIQMKAWCHGAPGIALARAGTLDLLDDEAIRAELETAIDSTLRVGLSGLDHLCCGNLGRVDVLFTSGRTLRDKGLVGESGGRAAMVLRRAIAQGSYRLRLEDAENRTFQPGFFRGSSGIGYQLLRLARPDDLPSILAFEPGPRLEEGRC
jgi:type 2 lantibiotic biosynthesis protein LanM